MNFQVSGGVSIPVTGEITTEAYSKIQFTVSTGTSDLVIDLQPTGDKLANFLLIKSSVYDVAKVYYKVNADDADSINLDGPHVFVGKGSVATLDSDPTQLLFTNELTEDITIDILLCRDATP